MALSSLGRALAPPPPSGQNGVHLSLERGVSLPFSSSQREARRGALSQSLGRAAPLTRCAAEGGSGAREWARQYPVREDAGAGSGGFRRGGGRGRPWEGRGGGEGRGTRGRRGGGDWNRAEERERDREGDREKDREGDREGGKGVESGSFREEGEPEGEREDFASDDNNTGGAYRSFNGRGQALGRGRGGGGRGGAGREGRWDGRASGGEGRGAAYRDGPAPRGRFSGQASGRAPPQFEGRDQAREGGSNLGAWQRRGAPGAEREGDERDSFPRLQLDAEGNLKGASAAAGPEPRQLSSAGTRTRQQRSLSSAEAPPGPRGNSDPAQPQTGAPGASGLLRGGEERGSAGAGGGRGVVREVDPLAPVRVSKLLAERGLCSRREADGFIERGLVLLDGQPVMELGTRALRTQHLSLAPQAQRQQASRLTVLLHKPVGYVSHADDDGAYPVAANLITPDRCWQGPRGPGGAGAEGGAQEGFGDPSEPPPRGLAPAGRLDIDSTGLLVLTQDGRVARTLVGEEGAVEKEYLVRVEGRISARSLALLNEGLSLDGRPLRPARVEWANEEQLRFVLREGRKRQIRRMCELVGLRVLALKRVRIGEVPLGNLPLGQWRVLAPHESF